MNKEMGKRKAYRKYSQEFKAQALERAEKEGIPATAQLLGLEADQLYSWRRNTRCKGESTETQARLEAENARLRKEMQRLEEELAFVKKCATYFAKAPR